MKIDEDEDLKLNQKEETINNKVTAGVWFLDLGFLEREETFG